VSALDLVTIGDVILDVVEDALNTLPAEDPNLLGAPPRVLSTPGLPVDDCCEQVALHVGPIRTRVSRDTKQVGWIYEVDFNLTVGRCVPTPEVTGKKIELPSVAALEASARQINADGWAIWNALHNAILRDGALPPECGKAAIQPLTPRDPSGGCGGWVGIVTLTVDGYDPGGS
jgi:hypothetical protein